LRVEKPLEFNKINSLNLESRNLTLKINQIIEKWVVTIQNNGFGFIIVGKNNL
jgi:hypothetical protein